MASARPHSWSWGGVLRLSSRLGIPTDAGAWLGWLGACVVFGSQRNYYNVFASNPSAAFRGLNGVERRQADHVPVVTLANTCSAVRLIDRMVAPRAGPYRMVISPLNG